MLKLPFSVIIPAAGFSGRMGTSKAELLTHSGESFLNHILNSYLSCGVNQIILVVSSHPAIKVVKHQRIKEVINSSPEWGRSYSLKLGLQHVNPGNCCFIHNIDNPFCDATLIEEMLLCADDKAFVVPSFENHKGHPVLLGKEIVGYLCTLEKIDNLKTELENFDQKILQWNKSGILLNINTPLEYSTYLKNEDLKS